MSSFFKRLPVVALLCLLAAACFIGVRADDIVASDITAQTVISAEGYSDTAFLHDGDIDTYRSSMPRAQITLTNKQGIGALYLLFDLEYGEYTIVNNDTGAVATAGKHSFLHEYIDLQACFDAVPTSVTLKFESGYVRLSELFVLSVGTPPDFVQLWDAPLNGKADIVLFSTHGDDEQLFFAGLLPYYAKERGYAVQVVYMTDHRNLTNCRTHEMLNGLWAVGVTAYPVFGAFEDFLIEDMERSYQEFERYGHTREELQAFVVENIRRFRPQVAIGHDIMGEYLHGMHMVYTDLLIKALDMTNDPAIFPESAQAYGVWDIPKTYLHLYEENPIVIDYDTPLDSFNGMTAFEVTQKIGYPCHKSQQWTWFTGWIYGKRGVTITKATEIEKHNPCLFGLYRSTVGPDIEKNDFMENITSYAEQERLEQERLEQERLEQERLEQERLEQERLEQERLEQERLEQERLEQERLEQERLEQERLEQERLEQERLEQERLEQEAQKRRQKLTVLVVLLCGLVALFAVFLSILIVRVRKQRRKNQPIKNN